MKVCSKCGVEKELAEFYKSDAGLFGVIAACKVCVKGRSKKYYEENKEDKKKYREENKEGIKEYGKKYREENKESRIEYNKKYREENKERIKEYNKKYAKIYMDRRSCLGLERRKTDPIFRLIINIRTRTGFALKPYGKKSKTGEILGCSFEEYVKHIEQLLPEGATMDMIGNEIHIDHFIPLASAKTEAQVLKLSHYSNLRPLWADLNMKKSDNMPYAITTEVIAPNKSRMIITPFLAEDAQYISAKLATLRKIADRVAARSLLRNQESPPL